MTTYDGIQGVTGPTGTIGSLTGLFYEPSFVTSPAEVNTDLTSPFRTLIKDLATAENERDRLAEENAQLTRDLEEMTALVPPQDLFKFRVEKQIRQGLHQFVGQKIDLPAMELIREKLRNNLEEFGLPYSAVPDIKLSISPEDPTVVKVVFSSPSVPLLKDFMVMPKEFTP